MQFDFRRQFREFLSQNLARLFQHDIATLAGCHAPQNQQMLEVIKIRIVRQAVAEINADGFINLRRAGVALGGQALNFLEPFGQAHFARQFDFGRRQQLVDRLL